MNLDCRHRLNTILESDHVIVMDVGNVCVFLSICEYTNFFQKIAEFDSPANLLKNTTSIFYSLTKEAGLVQ